MNWWRAWQGLSMEVRGGLLLVGAAFLALVFANTSLVALYQELLSVPVQVRIGSLDIQKPLLLWINDGLMALFFLAVGLEIKKEFLEGHLSSPSQVVLPGLCALAGMLVPAGIYAFLNRHDPVGLQGWAIPSATDIAFALGILALLGSRVPPALKVFVMTLAVLDDLGAVVVIALFYTSKLSLLSLSLAALFALSLFAVNRAGVRALTPYVLLGLALWASVLKSGVHATLAGIVIALMIPLSRREGEEHPPAERVLHGLHPWVVFAIVPLFAFANAGVGLGGLSLSDLVQPVPLGIAAGLFLGKQLGIFATAWLVIRAGWAGLPHATSWRQLYGAAVLCGIGFTMSLFISSLAFEHAGSTVVLHDRLGILAGSLASAILGYLVLKGGRSSTTA